MNTDLKKILGDTKSLEKRTTDVNEVLYGKTDPKAEREENLKRITALHDTLKISEKTPLDTLFDYVGINPSGISLEEDSFGKVTDGKYIQLIAISIVHVGDPQKASPRNVSLGYFGRAEMLDESLKHDIMEFVLRWKFEKEFHRLNEVYGGEEENVQ